MDPIKTIGRILDGESRRDAVHIAIAPVIAGEKLRPRDQIVLLDGKAVLACKGIGIVDPFLSVEYVMPGQQFWLWLTPGSITSLCHVWTHPAFDAPSTLREHLEAKRAS